MVKKILKQISFNVSENRKEEIRTVAEKRGLDIANYVRSCVIKDLNKKDIQ